MTVRIILGLILCTPSISFVSADELEDSPRVTPLVRVIRESEPAIVSTFVAAPDKRIVSGSGTIIHPDGFVLTNNHVVPQARGYILIGADPPNNQKPEQFTVIGRYPERDLAILKIHSNGPFPTVPLGRSNDLLNGETVVVAGNPGGRGLVFTSGIVSSRMVLAGAPNALVMTNYKIDRRPRFIQFDAASNGGNSGGPLINLEGDLIGIVSARIIQEQNIGFAIPVDVVYELIDDLIQPEMRHRKTVGIDLQSGTDEIIVGSVDEGLPAASAGLLTGDIITGVNGQILHNKVDWVLTLHSLLMSGRKFALTATRDEEQLNLNIQPVELQPQPASDVAQDELEPGLRYRLFDGKYSLVPEFDSLVTVGEGVVTAVNLNGVETEKQEYFAVEFSGFFHAEEESLYRLILASDDGSTLRISDEVIIDNDGNHPTQGVGELLYLAEGFHPLTIGYFQGSGEKELQLLVEKIGPEGKPVPVEGDMIWHRRTSTDE